MRLQQNSKQMDLGVNKVYVALDTSGNPRAWCVSCLVASTLRAFRDACDVRDAIGGGMRRQPTSKQVDLGVRARGSTKLESSALVFGHNLCRSGHLWEPMCNMSVKRQRSAPSVMLVMSVMPLAPECEINPHRRKWARA
jgi:hypothetical protein